MAKDKQTDVTDPKPSVRESTDQSQPKSAVEQCKAALGAKLNGNPQNVEIRPKELGPIMAELKKSSVEEVATKAKQLEKLPNGTPVVVAADWLKRAVS